MASGEQGGEARGTGPGPALRQPALLDAAGEGVQTFGAVLELTRELVVSRCSPNVETVLGVRPDALFGRPLASALGPEVEASARAAAATLRAGGAHDLGRVTGAGPLRATLFAGADAWRVELLAEASLDAAEVVQLWHDSSALLATDATLEALCERVVVGVRRLTGHDRVVVVRFGGGAGGRTLAEARADGLGPLPDPQWPAGALWRAGVDRIWGVADVDAATAALLTGPDAEPALAPEVG